MRPQKVKTAFFSQVRERNQMTMASFPRDHYNLDETGFQLAVEANGKVVARKRRIGGTSICPA